MKNFKKIILLLTSVATLVGCTNQTYESQGEPDICPYNSYVNEWNKFLVWKLTKEEFFNQKDEAEKEDEYNFIVDVVYSWDEGLDFANVGDKINIKYFKTKQVFDHITYHGFDFDLIGNYTKIFQKYDYILVVNSNKMWIEDDKLVVNYFYTKTPYAFIDNTCLAINCYDAFTLFYDELLAKEEYINEYTYFSQEGFSQGEDTFHEEDFKEMFYYQTMTEEVFLERVHKSNLFFESKEKEYTENF